jgi:gamma-glutamyl:cysteine ligase YbdK (ATP-grasp superfamily)
MRAQREFVVQLEQGKSVTLLRPTDMEVQRDLLKVVPPKPTEKQKVELHIDTDKVHTHATAWVGFTEADLLGPDGGSDAVEFDQDLLQAYLANNVATANTLVDGLYGAIVAHINAKAEAEKN